MWSGFHVPVLATDDLEERRSRTTPWGLISSSLGCGWIRRPRGGANKDAALATTCGCDAYVWGAAWQHADLVLDQENCLLDVLKVPDVRI